MKQTNLTIRERKRLLDLIKKSLKWEFIPTNSGTGSSFYIRHKSFFHKDPIVTGEMYTHFLPKVDIYLRFTNHYEGLTILKNRTFATKEEAIKAITIIIAKCYFSLIVGEGLPSYETIGLQQKDYTKELEKWLS